MNTILPEGLKVHCDTCQLVIPADAPVADEADCESVVQAKLSWFDPTAPRAAQFAMAAGTWSLIHYQHLRSEKASSQIAEYGIRLHTCRKQAYAASAARQALTPEQVDAEASHRKFGWLHAKEPI